MTYYNGTLFPPSVQDFSLDIGELKLLPRRERKAAAKPKKALDEKLTQPSLDFGGSKVTAKLAEKAQAEAHKSRNVLCVYLLFLFGTIAVLVTFLVHQGYLFFSSIEDNQVSAISSAVVAELLPFAAAVMLGFSRSKAFKVLLALILVACIGGLACFMYASLSLRMDEHSEVAQQAKIERVALEQSLQALGESLTALPSSHVSKRQAVIAEMSSLQKELRLSESPVYKSWHSSNANIQLAYSVWLRVAAMILNALLIHNFTSVLCYSKDGDR